MSLFEGNFSSSTRDNHVFIIEDALFEAIGFCSTNRSNFYEMYDKNRRGIQLIYEDFPTFTKESNPTVFNLFPESNGVYEYFDGDNKIWSRSSMSVATLFDILTYWDQLRVGINQAQRNKSIEKIISAIMQSLTQCITFTYQYKNVSWLKINTEDEIKIKVFFQKRDQVSNERVLATKGDLLFSATPRTNTGKKYAYRATDQLQSASSLLGSYAALREGGDDNPQNTVAATLDMVFNKNSGRFEAGNRSILAKLVTDLPPAEVKPFVAQDKQEYNNTDFYVVNGGNYIGAFSSGVAIPVSKENNNPYMLGPNFVQCQTAETGQQLEKVVVINRSNNSFTAGDTILLTNIDNEWLVQKFLGEPAEDVASMGEWSFTKMIVDSDSYFKDGRYYTAGSNSETITNYEQHSRNLFYYNQIRSIGNNVQSNAHNAIDILKDNVQDPNKAPDFVPSYRYLISSVYDQMPKYLGGFQDDSFKAIQATNLALTETPLEKAFNPHCLFFWGPLFSEGYRRIFYNDDEIKANIQNNKYPNHSKYYTTTDFLFAASIGADLYDGLGQNDVPAEMTTNIIDMIPIMQSWNSLGEPDATETLLKNGQTIPSTLKTSLPVSNNRILFVPLTAEMCAHHDYWAVEGGTRQGLNRGRQFRRTFLETLSLREIENVDNIWGNMYERSKFLNFPTRFGNVNSSVMAGCNVYDADGIAKIGKPSSPTVTYDCFIKRRPTSVPLGTNDLFQAGGDYFGANAVGVIAAHVDIRKNLGGDIKFAVFHNSIGLTSDDFLLNQDVDYDRNTEGGLKTVTYPRWGSSSDSVYSFGTTALHVRIFDYWPKEQTIFDPRYFGVLHFNPGKINSIVETQEVDRVVVVDNTQTVAKVNVDVIGSDVDFRIPTYYNNEIIPVGTRITDQILTAPLDQWRVNAIRRGQLLSGEGFLYKAVYLGLNVDDSDIIDTGAGFVKGDVIPLDKDVVITIDAVNDSGGITAYRLVDKNSKPQLGTSFSSANLTLQEQDDKVKSYILYVPPITENRNPDALRSARIQFFSFITWEREEVDNPPTEYTGSLGNRLTAATANKEYIDGTVETSVSVDKNTTGRYDCYFMFHNDISHTFMLPQLGTIPGFAQYLDMLIT